MARFSPARFIAPLALIAVAAAAVVVVKKETHHSAKPVQTSTVVHPARRHASKKPRTYVVKQGDTLSAIAQRAKVPLATLQKLNPSIDPQTVHAGQRLKLSR